MLLLFFVLQNICISCQNDINIEIHLKITIWGYIQCKKNKKADISIGIGSESIWRKKHNQNENKINWMLNEDNNYEKLFLWRSKRHNIGFSD